MIPAPPVSVPGPPPGPAVTSTRRTSARSRGEDWLRRLAPLAGLTLLALALRWPYLAIAPRFTDESLEVTWSLPIARGDSFPLTNYDAYYGALFNYLVAAAFRLVGPGAEAARLVVLATGVLTVVATFGLGRAWGGPAAGLLAGGLLAVNAPHAAISSHVAWSNCTTPLFTTLAIWALSRGVRAAETGGRHGRVGLLLPLSGLLWGLALQTHPAVVALLPGAAVYVAWKGRRLLATPWPYLAILCFLLGYANVILYNVGSNLESIATAQRMRQEYATDEDAASGYPATLGAALLLLGRALGSTVDNRDSALAYWLDGPLLLTTVLALGGLLREWRRGNPLPSLLVGSALLLLPALNPKFHTLITSRYLMPLLPILFAGLAGLLVASIVGRRPARAGEGWRRGAALVAAAGLLLLPLPRLAGYYGRLFEADDTNERAYFLTHLVDQHRRPAERLVLDESFGSETGGVSELRALRYLLSFDDVPVRVLKITPRRLEAELGDESSILVVLNGRQLDDFDRLPLQPLSPVPHRGREVGLFRLAAGEP